VADPISAPPGVFVPPAALEVHAVRSGGPGGQNVNKVASKILLEVDLSKVEGLDTLARRRLATLAGRRLGADGVLRVTAQESRDQYRNLAGARDKVRDLLEKAQVAPKSRRATRPSRAAREKRLKAKRVAAAHKERRGAVREDD
jgi:ribosome-associated protein